MKKYFTKAALLSLAFYFVFMGAYFSWQDGWRHGVIEALIAAVIFALFMPLLQKINFKMGINLMGMRIENEENAILCGGANHFKNGEAVGGKMVLFHDELVFKSHKINIQNHELHIPLSDIVAMAPYAIANIFPTGLKITLANGEVEKFVVNKREDWIDAIHAAQAINA